MTPDTRLIQILKITLYSLVYKSN